MLLGTLDVTLLGNMLARKGINRVGHGIIRAGYGSEEFSIKISSKKKEFGCCLTL